ncbi:MAG TPA: ATP-binding cassette domain-containing protein [Candidatus Limiplasma sp.]|nr:ATP-binding cassette domain-containing protein [Candidatus Limiplasma sp.]
MILAAEHLYQSFDGQPVLKDLSFTVESGETLVIAGRSGCGKTTLLRILAGFLPPDQGRITLDGEPSPRPDQDKLMVFQSFDQLFPWFTLRGNIQYALKKARPALKKHETRELAIGCLHEMGLQDAQEKYPYQLSGGMKQRGALARAMALSPKVLLLDEPFSSLDVHSRENAHQSLQTLKEATGAAVVLVTHDLQDAAALATRIAVLQAETHGIVAEMDNDSPDVTLRLRELLTD